MDTPSISIIIPCYQKAYRLRACLDSVLQQSLVGIEVICVNDGSTDGSKDILDSYVRKYAQIRVFHQENQGVSAARNFGIDQARGEFIAFMDADDEYPSVDTLEHLYRRAKEHHVAVAGGGIIYKIKGEIKESDNPVEKEYALKKSGITPYADYQYDYGFTRFIYKRSLINEQKLRFPQLICLEDPVFYVQVMHAAKSFYASMKPSYVYYFDIDTRPHKRAAMIDTLRGLLMIMRFARQHGYSRLEALAQIRFYSNPQYHHMHQYNLAGDVEIISHFLAVAREIDRYPLSKDVQEMAAQYIRPHKRLARGALLRTLKRIISFRALQRDNVTVLGMLSRYVVSCMIPYAGGNK